MDISRKNQISNYLIWGYLGFVLPLNLVGHVYELTWMNYVSKPMFMIFLMAIVFISNQPIKLKTGLIIALFFSWIGDLVLMFDATFPMLFMVGLGAFFLAHITYVYIFISTAKKVDFSGVKIRGVIMIFALYTLGLIYVLWPNLGDLRIPVLAYAIILLFMGITSAVRLNTGRYYWVLAGAILFIASDSLLAINKFVNPIWMSGIWIMTTYTLAQLLIVLGLTKISANAGS